MLLADAVSRDLLVAPLAHVFSVRPGQHLGDLIDAKINSTLLANTIDTGKELLGRQSAVIGLTRRKAIIASVAGFILEFFTKIGEQIPPPASRALGVMDHLL